MKQNTRRGGSRTAPAAGGQPTSLSISISLPEIYASLCPSCREAFLDLLEAKAGTGLVRDALRRQLESASGSQASFPAHPEPVEGSS